MSVLSHLQGVASSLNIAERESESIARSIGTLSRRLQSHFGDSIQQEIRFGSSTRETMLPRVADPQSDVDYMVVFDNTARYRPQTFMSRLRGFTGAYYQSSEVHQSSPTVVLSLNHIKFDLVPAYRSSTSYWQGNLQIPAPSSSFEEWMSTDPQDLNQPLADKNKLHGYRIKPLIRLLKYWNARHAYVYESFALEKHLTHSSYWLANNLKDYLYDAVASLPTTGLPAYKLAKVRTLQSKIEDVKSYEARGMPYTAEEAIAEIFPL